MLYSTEYQEIIPDGSGMRQLLALPSNPSSEKFPLLDKIEASSLSDLRNRSGKVTG
jgi:hypothetical protein